MGTQTKGEWWKKCGSEIRMVILVHWVGDGTEGGGDGTEGGGGGRGGGGWGGGGGGGGTVLGGVSRGRSH